MTNLALFLVATLLKVTALLALTALAAVLLRRASAATRHALWTASLAAVLVLGAVAWVVPEWKVIPAAPLTAALDVEAKAALDPAHSDERIGHVSAATPTHEQPSATITAAERVNTAARTARPREARVGGAAARKTVIPSEAKSAAHEDTRASGVAATQPDVRTRTTTTSAGSQSAVMTAAPVWLLKRATGFSDAELGTALLILWLCGSVAIFARYVFHFAMLLRASRHSRSTASGSLYQRFRAGVQSLGIRRRVALVESTQIEVPMTWGVIRPTILLPQTAEEWSTERVDAVLQHELAHVKRFDAFTQWLAQLACALYWFHPLVWYAAKQMRAERERACDDFVLHSGIQPSAYASDLLEIVSGFHSSTEHYPAGLAMARRSQFEGRLMALLNPNANRATLSPLQMLITIVLVAAIALPLAALSTKLSEQTPTAEAVVQRARKGIRLNQGTAPTHELAAPTAELAAPTQDLTVPTAELQAAHADLQMSRAETAMAKGELEGKLAELSAARGDLATGLTNAPRTLAELRAAQTAAAPATTAIAPAPARAATVVAPASTATTPVAASARGSAVIAVSPAATSAAPAAVAAAPAQSATTPAASRAARASSAPVISASGVVYVQNDTNPTRSPQAVKGAVGPDLLSGCTNAKGTRTSTLSHSDDDRGTNSRMEVIWEGPDCELRMKARSKFTFNSDFTGFQTIERGGSIDIEVDTGETTKLNIRPASDGTLEYKFTRNGTETPFANGGAGWLAQFMVTLDRMSAVGIDVRFPKLMREGGPSRVLAETEAMYGNHPRGKYLRKLLESAQLNDNELQRVLEIDRGIDSDYEKAGVLMAVAKKYDLRSGVRDAFLAVTHTMTSDYEHARSLLAFFEKGSATPEQARAILESVKKMGSDYERARVLIKLAELHKLAGDERNMFITAASAMGSDYEKGRTLRTAIKTQGSDDQTAMAVIEAAKGMGSDYEKGQVLRALADARTLDGKLKDAYIQAARNMGSDYERKRALSAVGADATKMREPI